MKYKSHCGLRDMFYFFFLRQLEMDSIDGSFDYSFSVDSPTGLNQGFLLNTDNAIDSNMYGVIPETPRYPQG